MPYVNLSSAQIDVKVLDLLPADIAERYMAVPLGEMSKRLAVAMLDANNAVSYTHLDVYKRQTQRHRDRTRPCRYLPITLATGHQRRPPDR